MKVFIYSGVPGSGKSTLIRERHRDAIVCSADHYFEVNGEYRFDPTKIGDAHAACLRKFIGLVNGPIPEYAQDVVVDNTNTSVAEIAPYMAIAQAYGHEAAVITVWCDPNIAANRNTHGVPVAAVLRMNATLLSRELPPWWKREDVTQPGFSTAFGLTVESHNGVTPNDSVVANRALDGGE